MEETKTPIIVEENIDFRALAKVLWAGRRLILSITAATTLIGILYALLATPFYKASLSIYPATGQPGSLGQLQNLASTFGMNIGGTEKTYNIPDVVKSRRVSKALLKHKWETDEFETPGDLITYWEINKTGGFSLNPLNWIKAIFSRSDPSDEELARKWEDEALKKLSDLISVSEDRNTSLIRISVLMEEPQLAADVANYIADAVTEYIHLESSFEASRNRQFIEERQTVVQGELERAENSLRDFRERNRQIVDSPDLQLEEGRLFRQVEMKQQVYITLQQQLELSRIEEVKQTPVIHVLDKAEAPIQKEIPKRKMIVILSFMLGSAAGIGLHIISFKYIK
ncbi:Wzz/FepE/Etk N-terminal domain-containing protein [Candidatus Neomarinimicrobiota bacterium]